MTRLSRADSRTRTRALLLDAAERVFARRGYRGATVDEIAAEAGFSKGAVYSNFAGKEELFLALLDRHLHVTPAVADALSPTLGPAGGDVRVGVAATGGGVPRSDAPGALEALTSLATPVDPTAWEWGLLTMEFFLYAAREPTVRDRLAAVLEGQRADLTSMLEAAWPQLASGPISPRELASVVMALSTGLGVQVVLDPASIDPSLFSRVLGALVEAEPRAVETTSTKPRSAGPRLAAGASARRHDRG